MLIEFSGALFRMLSPVLRMVGMEYSFIPELFDAFMVFVLVPIIHLLNDEDTKSLLVKKDYLQALKSTFSFETST